MNIRQIGLVLCGLSVALLTSCQSLLDETPDERVYLTTPETIRLHLVNAYPSASFAYLCELASDNIDDYGEDNPEFSNYERDAAYWLDGQEYNNSDGLRAIWREHYSAIQHANTALQAIERLGGGTELNPHKGEALIARAYAHFVLVNIFGKHYNTETSSTDLGIPYMTLPEVELAPKYERNTVAEVYQAIDRDITEGLPLISDSYYKQPKYHFNRAAAEAFAARFYLFYEQWDKAIEHATKALEGKTLRRWSDYRVATVVGAKTEDAYAKLYSRSDLEANLMVLPVTSRAHTSFSYTRSQRFSMTHRAAEEVFLAQNIWTVGTASADEYQQTPFISSANNYRDVIYQAKYPAYTSNSSRTLVIPFTTEETLLVRAEAKVLAGDNSGALEDANLWTSTYLNTEKKTFTESEVDAFWQALSYSTDTAPTMKKPLQPKFALTGGDAQQWMLQHVLQCRRIATAHEGLRWFDIRRYGITIYRYVHDRRDRSQFTVGKTLTPEDPHTSFQLPQNVIAAGMTPNPR